MFLRKMLACFLMVHISELNIEIFLWNSCIQFVKSLKFVFFNINFRFLDFLTCALREQVSKILFIFHTVRH